MTHYKCKHFRIEELVPRSVFHRYGNQCWEFFNPKALYSLDQMRDYFKKVISVNGWLWCPDGSEYRGLRPPDCKIGAPMSQHRFGNAFDLDVDGMCAEEVRQAIRRNQDLFEHITCMEDGVDWLHFDCRNTLYRIKLFHP